MARARKSGGLPHRLPKRVTTVSDLFTRDDVNDILSDLTKRKDKITAMVVITLDKDNMQHWWITDGTLCSTATWMMECTKYDLISEATETD